MIRKLCAVLLCVLLGTGWMIPVRAEEGSMPERMTVSLSITDGEEADPAEADSDQQMRNAIFYLMPSVVMAAVLTVIVVRQKMENKNR